MPGELTGPAWDSTLPRFAAIALPTAIFSAVVAAFVLISPSLVVKMLSWASATGSLFWVIGGIAACINVLTYFASIKTKVSTQHLLNALGLICMVQIVLIIFEWFPVVVPHNVSMIPVLTALPASELLARSYFGLVTAIFFPWTALRVLAKVAATLVNQTQNKTGPPAVPAT